MNTGLKGRINVRLAKWENNPMSLICYLRNRMGLTQTALSKESGLTYQAVRRAENKSGGTVRAMRVLSKFFGVSIDALARNDFGALAGIFSAPPKPVYTQRDRMCENFKIKDEVGRSGEAVVADAERAKLAGTKYVNLVNENCSDDLDAGFDIFSFTEDGRPIYIEVKATKKKSARAPFHLSAGERDFMLRCAEEGINYELHRVYDLYGKDGWKREIYTANELVEMFNFKAESFIVSRKGA